MARRKRTEEERQARIELILDSAATLFLQKGYGNTSINDIAEAADLSRTLIYQYFNNKEEIYLQILERYTDLVIDTVAETTASVGTMPEKIKAFLGGMRQVMKEKPNFFELFFIQRHQLEPLLSPELKAQLNAKRKKLENVFRDSYKRGIEKGEVRNIRAKDASNLFFAQIMGMMLLRHYYDDEYDVTLDEHLDKSLQLYLEFVEKVDQ